LNLSLARRQTLQRADNGIEGALEAIHAVVQRLRIKVVLGFELTDAVAGMPPGYPKANGTDRQALRSDEQCTEKKAGGIHAYSST